MSKNVGSVRMGPISIFTLVVILCLAVLSVLSFTTARAASAVAQREAVFTSDTYANEALAQQFLSNVDSLLTQVRSEGHASGEALQANAMEQLSLNANTLSTNAEISIEGNQVTAVFLSENGRRLIVVLDISKEARYTVIQWTFSTREEHAPRSSALWIPD